VVKKYTDFGEELALETHRAKLRGNTPKNRVYWGNWGLINK